MSINEQCPIWGTPAQVESYESAAGSKMHYVSGFNVDSERTGGCYAIDKQARDEIGKTGFDKKIKARITTWIVNERALGVERPKVSIEILNRVKTYPPLSVHERADRLLKYIADQSPQIGETFSLYPGINSTPSDPKHLALANSESLDESEVLYLLDYLEAQGYLTPGSSVIGRRDLIVSPHGYSRIMELENRRPLLVQGFVAMWFDKSMDEVYEKGFEKALIDAGYRPVRIDRKDHNNKIDDEIIAEIRRSRFLVADFTYGEKGPRGGVYYEAGFAQGLNIPVIYTCRKDLLDEVHFDTRQFNHIGWESADELAARLSVRISATIGDGPLKMTPQ